MIKRIGLLTSGGDAPGMNAAIRSVVRYGLHHKLEVIGIYRGYAGLINEDLKSLDHRSVAGIIKRGGTILESLRCDEFLTEEGQRKAVEILKRNEIDALIVLGGDGTYRGAIQLWEKWHIPCVGIPATIDNDINGTDITIGADTAINTALEAVDKIRDTSTSMARIFVVEVMGRESGFIASQVALASGAEEVLVPEITYDLDDMCHDIERGYLKGKERWIIIVAEGEAKAGEIANKITEISGSETRVVVLGHVQRGGSPTAKDRILATRLGAAAVDLILNNKYGKAVGVKGNQITVVDLHRAVEKKNGIGVNSSYQLMRNLI
ncbi:Pyrophosphate--fructose 6-phosphate 1-phosphotransferase [ANME-1 cluster archaeon GoMg3.2]|nr:Pyrophosphate--fructose 6-phosphate 1-phosphotransferase [ANME-1 cluster archaeon GoMg3.2]